MPRASGASRNHNPIWWVLDRPLARTMTQTDLLDNLPQTNHREERMTTRRVFLKHAAATGMVFCSCGLIDAARAQGAAPRALPVTVNGKRVKTIDVHAHCLFHESLALLGEQARNARPQ